MYVVTVEFKVDPTQFGEFMVLMLENAARSREEEPGCNEFHVCVDPDRENAVFLYEIYENKAAFEDHKKTPHFLEFSSKTADMIVDRDIRVLQLIAS